MPLKIVWMQKQVGSSLSPERSALSFSGGTAQIRRTPEGTGVNPLERLCGRENQNSDIVAADAEFPGSTGRNIPPDAPKVDALDAPLNGVEGETIAGNSGKLQFRMPFTSSASRCVAPAP
jgi:hypothetical protein